MLMPLAAMGAMQMQQMMQGGGCGMGGGCGGGYVGGSCNGCCSGKFACGGPNQHGNVQKGIDAVDKACEEIKKKAVKEIADAKIAADKAQGAKK